MFTQRYALRKISRAKGASPFETPTQAPVCVLQIAGVAAINQYSMACSPVIGVTWVW